MSDLIPSGLRLPNDLNALLQIRIRSENFYKITVFPQQFDRLGHFGVLIMADTIDEKEIFPRLALAGAGLDFRQVDLVFAKRGNGFVQRPRLVRHTDHQTRPVIARERAALTAQHQEPRRICRVVLNVFRQ